MALIDINKNSLPEQVQENKDNIATLMTDPTTKQYVDNQDAATLQSAKNYTDDKFPITVSNITSGSATAGQVITADGYGVAAWGDIPTPEITASDVDSETATAGQVLTADGNGDAAWGDIPKTTASDVNSETATAGQVLIADGNGAAAWSNIPTPEITASNVDSETATAGQVLTADGNGDAAWATISAGGLTLKWSGSLTLTSGSVISPFSFEQGKNYFIQILFGSGEYYQPMGICHAPNINDGYSMNVVGLCYNSMNGRQCTYTFKVSYSGGNQIFSNCAGYVISTTIAAETTYPKIVNIYEVN